MCYSEGLHRLIVGVLKAGTASLLPSKTNRPFPHHRLLQHRLTSVGAKEAREEWNDILEVRSLVHNSALRTAQS
jgi:hypothetical protein